MARGPRVWLWAAMLLLPASAWADEVHLRSGGVVRGVIVERNDERVVIEAGPGRVTLPMSRVERVTESGSAMVTFHRRYHALSPRDVAGFARLARWAEDHDLATSARQAWQRVLQLDPGHPEANGALGRTSHEGVWMDAEDAYRIQGFVSFEGEWVSPVEREAILRERAQRDLARAERREAELRVREAEARAREAEARAREAEAYADQVEEPQEGIPYWWVLYGGGGGYWPPPAGGPRPPATLPEKPGRPGHGPSHPPATPPSSIWSGSPSPRTSPRPAAPPRSSAPRSSGSSSLR